MLHCGSAFGEVNAWWIDFCTFLSYFQVFQMSGTTALNLGCITNFEMGFISLVGEIKVMLISSGHFGITFLHYYMHY